MARQGLRDKGFSQQRQNSPALHPASSGWLWSRRLVLLPSPRIKVRSFRGKGSRNRIRQVERKVADYRDLGTHTMVGGGVKVKAAPSCLTLCGPMDYTVYGILQARILEWGAFPFSRTSWSSGKQRPERSHSENLKVQESHRKLQIMLSTVYTMEVGDSQRRPGS